MTVDYFYFEINIAEMKCSNCGWPLGRDLRCHICGTNNASPDVKKDQVSVLDLKGHALPNKLQGVFQPLQGERYVGIWHCHSLDEEKLKEDRYRKQGNGLFSPSLASHYSKQEGMFVLSDRRMLFMSEEYKWDKMVRTDEIIRSLGYAIDFSAIAGLRTSSDALTILVKHDEVNVREVHLFKISLVSWEDLRAKDEMTVEQARFNLQLLVDRYHEEMEKERSRMGTKVIMDFSFLKDILERGGIIIQSTKCPNCGSAVRFPEGGTMVRCTYCGSDLQAYDILERLRSIIQDGY